MTAQRLTGLASMAVHPMVTAAVHTTGSPPLPHIDFRGHGGVDAVRRVEEGEVCDLVVLAQPAVERLVALGHLAGASARVVATSAAAVAVRRGAARPRIDDEDRLRESVEQASAIAYSTGPSGAGLLSLLERWGLLETRRPRLVQTAPGQPVAELLAEGRAELGVQQLSELVGHPDVDVLGLLPPGCEVLTSFVGAATTATWAVPEGRAAVDEILAHLASPRLNPVRERFGLCAVRTVVDSPATGGAS